MEKEILESGLHVAIINGKMVLHLPIVIERENLLPYLEKVKEVENGSLQK